MTFRFAEPVLLVQPAPWTEPLLPIAHLARHGDPSRGLCGAHLADPPTHAPPDADRCVVCEEMADAVR